MLSLKTKSVVKVIVSVTTALLLTNISVYFLAYFYAPSDHRVIEILYKAFDFNHELNLPTFFTSMLHFFNCSLLFIIGKVDNSKLRKYWYVLSVLFLFTALDEMLLIHERLNVPVRNFLDTSGSLYFAWIIPYAIAILIIGVFFIKFFRQLPKKTFIYFAISAVVFVTGAIGMEVLQSSHYETNGRYTTIYFIMYTLEETLEMFGLCLFSFGLMHYLTAIKGEVKIKFSK